MNKKKIEVSFVIIEYDSLNDVLKCVGSIENNYQNLSYEIIISSNFSYDFGKQQSLKQQYPQLKWSFNKQNNGFAYGMNCGISISRGAFIVLQNPTTSIQNNKLIEALELIKKDNTIGLIGPKMLNDKREVQDSCRSFLTPSKIVSRLIKRALFYKESILDKNFNYNKTQSVDWVIGAFMITSREAINTVGKLDEDFFMYVEDMDWCLRFWENNLKVLYYPSLVVKYEGNRKSTKIRSNILPLALNKYTLIHIRSYLTFIRKLAFRKLKELKYRPVPDFEKIG